MYKRNVVILKVKVRYTKQSKQIGVLLDTMMSIT